MDYERRLLVKVAELYYQKEMTQNQIAKQLNLSRIKISRMLKKSIEMGIVTIKIDYTGLFSDLERKIQEIYSLKEIIIVDADETDYSEKISETAGYYLNQHLQEGDIVTVGWGDTLRRTVNYCGGELSKDTIFTPIIGGHSSQFFTLHSNTISSDLASRYHAKSLSLLAPAFVSSKESRMHYMEEDHIRNVIKCSSTANKAIFSVGSPQYEKSTIIQTGYFKENELKKIKQSGAVCDIASIIFLDKNGNSILSEFTERSIGLNETQFLAIPHKICIAGGVSKHETIKAALKAKLVDTLITDLSTAEYLLK